MKLRDLLPYPIWSRLQLFRSWLRELPERRRIASLKPRVPRDRLAICTAGSSSAEPGKPLRGGRVKLAPLERRFPGSAAEFNVLYLVSSALPEAADAWIAAARRAGARVVWNQNGIAYPGWIGRAHELLNRPVKDLLPQADVVLYQSEYCRASTEHFVGSVARAKQVLHNAVDTSKFTPRDVELPREPLVLLAAGTQQTTYRVRTALETLKLLREAGVAARLRLAGGLDLEGGRALVERMMSELGVTDVELVGTYARDAAPALYRSAHILIHTVYKDACPTTVLESMACGVPVVATATGGVPELVGDTGGLVPVRESWDEMVAPDPALLADAVRRVAADLPALARAARRRAVEQFDEKSWLDRHEALFRELTGVAA